MRSATRRRTALTRPVARPGARGADELDRFVDAGARRNAVEEPELVRAEPESGADWDVEVGR